MSDTWEQAILCTMERLGGRDLPLRKIYEEMEAHPLVTPYHGKPWKLGKQARYECWIRRALTNLVRKGLVDRVT